MKGKIILVTDAHKRLGQALVCALLERGVAKVYAASKSEPIGREDGLTSDKVIRIQLDVTNPATVAAAVKQFRDVEVFFNTTSIDHEDPVAGPLGLNAVRRAALAESTGTLALCLALAPGMAERGGGLIVDICSHASLIEKQLNGLYRRSLEARNIRVVAIILENSQALTIYYEQPEKANFKLAIDKILS
ncbi:SDR family NAD(P)-dependent oxidoreductase [Geomonas ferrireducens]|uniref:SDR family NAD(P)-dependent oxidoreductase n=1 Tax=Geomonas ferrireducens TaxID=2570227 RepID=UPI0013A5C429|nr:SDR family NAD(P)-dependent oxidoreductase [Geomonas ferrireducens]